MKDHVIGMLNHQTTAELGQFITSLQWYRKQCDELGKPVDLAEIEKVYHLFVLNIEKLEEIREVIEKEIR